MNAERENLDLEFRLSRLVDGDLSVEEAADLRRRLEHDPAARDELRRYRSLEAHLAAMAPAWTEADYDAQRRAILSGVRDRLAARRRGWRVAATWGPLAAAAAIALALVASFVWPGGNGRPVVDVALLPEVAPLTGLAEATVVAHPLSDSELSLGEAEPRPDRPALPPGTVMVSIDGASPAGPAPAGPAAGVSALPIMELY